MKSTLRILFAILVCTWNTLNAQVKNENAPKTQQDSAVNFTKPQKSITYNAVTVKANRWVFQKTLRYIPIKIVI